MKVIKYAVRVDISLLLLLGCMLAGSGCKESICSGDLIFCYKYKGDFIGSFCSDVAPPCECYEYYDGNTDPKSQLALFSKACDNSITGGGPAPVGAVDEAYKFECPSIFDDALCTEFDVYYSQVRPSFFVPYDMYYRPIYVRFSIEDFSLVSFDYQFDIKNSLGDIITTVSLTKETLEKSISEDLIRHLNPPICLEASCPTVGTLKINTKDIPEAGNYDIVMSKILRTDVNRSLVEIATTDFEVKTSEPGALNRVFNLVYFAHPQNNSDLTKNTLKDRTFAEAIEHTFGAERSNIRFNMLTQTIAEPYVDEFTYAMLDEDNFFGSDISNDVYYAGRLWTEEVFETLPDYPITYLAFGLEISNFKAYDFSVFPAEENVDLSSEIQSGFQPLGWAPHEGETVYSGGYRGFFVIRQNILDQMTILGRSSDEADFSVTVFLHEMAHSWTPSGSQGGSDPYGCDSHSMKGNGRNYNYCLWHWVCTEAGTNPLTTDQFINASFDDPKFCEGHQQYFMNRFTSR